MGAKPTLAEINKLLWQLIIPFHQIERDMPLPVDGKRNENDSEHSWALALLSSALAPQLDPSLDVGKVCVYAVVHDLVEVYAGDVSVWGSPDDLAAKAEREAEALVKIKAEFAAFPWIGDAVAEYEAKQSPEALFVYAADKYLNLLVRSTDNSDYFKAKQITKQMFDIGVAKHRKKAHRHPAIAPLYDELLETFNQRPDFFYQVAA